MSIIPGRNTQVFGAAFGEYEPRAAFDRPPTKVPSWRKYGLTDQMYLAMVAQQGGRCAICHETGRLVVDHDHETGKVRALLCHRCNVTLGFLRDEPELAELVVEYLRKHESAGGEA